MYKIKDMVKKKKNMTIILIVIISIVIVGGVLTWGFLTHWGQGKKSEPLKYTVTKKIPKGNKIEIENPESHGFKIGQKIEIGTGENKEIRTIVGFGSLILDRPLTKDYPENTVITVVEEPIKKDFKVDNCQEYTVDLTCKECGDSYYLQDNKCKKYDVVESKEILKKLIKTTLPDGYSKNEKDEYIKKDGTTKNYGPIRTWQLGKDVTDLSGLFNNNATFNENISGWNVSNVTNMRGMFSNAFKFNQPLDKWDVSNVTDMVIMFDRELMSDGNTNPNAFNQDLSGWKLNCNVNIDSMFWTGETKKSLMEEKYKPKKPTTCS
jgi:surface protein